MPRLALVTALCTALALAAPAAGFGVIGGIVGPNPVANGGFSAAVPDTATAPGWYVSGSAENTPTATFVDVDGDLKVRTLGHTGSITSPTNMGLTNERPAYSGLFEKLTFEVTDTKGHALRKSGVTAVVFMYHAVNQGTVEEEPTVGYCLHYNDPSTAAAASGLHRTAASEVTDCFGTPVTYFGRFTEEQLANEFQLGSFRVYYGGTPVLMDNIEIHGAVLFGTYV